MTVQFNPYHKWLGISPKDQPPNHYRLLGIDLFESDADAIANAADQRMALLRSFQTGKHSNLSQIILNEVAAARVCLLNPRKKTEYDENLRATLSLTAEQSKESYLVGIQPDLDVSSRLGPAYSKGRKKKNFTWAPWVFVSLCGAAAAVVLLALAEQDNREIAKEPANKPQVTRKREAPHKPVDGARPPQDPPTKPQPISIKRPLEEPAPRQEEVSQRPPAKSPPRNGKGLLGEYFAGVNFGRKIIERTDQKIDFSWPGRPDPRVQARNYSVRWTGWLKPPQAGRYTLAVVSDDGARLVLEGKKLIDSWHNRSATRDAVEVDLGAGPHRLQLDYFNGRKGGIVQLRWLRPGSAVEEVMPLEVFFQDRNTAENTVVQLVARPGPGPETAANSQAKLPLPDKDARKAAEHLIADVYGEKLAALNGYKHQTVARINAIVLWNQYNTAHRDRGADICNVVLMRKKTPVWRSDGLRVPWAPGEDTFLRVRVPNVFADEVRVEIVTWHGAGGGLSEVQVFSGKDNIAENKQAIANNYSRDYSADKLVDGITSSSRAGGYWLLPNNTQGWAGIGLVGPNLASPVVGEMFEKAKSTEKKQAARFVLLETCKGVAAQSLDYDLAFKIIDCLSSDYDVDGLQMKVETVENAAKQSLGDQRTAVAEAAMKAVDTAVEEDDYDTANRLGKLAVRLLRRGFSQNDLLKEIAARNREVQAAEKQYNPAREAMAVLTEKPDDADANLTVGKYQCFIKGDWRRGLPMLAKGSDATWKSLAAEDVAGAALPGKQVKLGDAWFDGDCKTRAAFWYKKALPGLTGLEKERIRKKLIECVNRIYLRDLPAQEASVWEGNIHRKMSFRESPMLHSLFAHPPNHNTSSHIAYQLDSQFRVLKGEVGVLTGHTSRTHLTFRIVADGNLLWKSNPIQEPDIVQSFFVNVAGVKKLELFVDCPGTNGHAWAAWLDPVLMKN